MPYNVDMVEQFKKDRILEKVRHGMSLETIYDLLYVSTDEQAELDQDDEFKASVSAAEAELQSALMSDLWSVIDKETEKGTSATLRWFLERRYPLQFGKATDGPGSDSKPSFPWANTATDELRKKTGSKSRFLECE